MDVNAPLLPGRRNVVEVPSDALVTNVGPPIDSKHGEKLDLRVAHGKGGVDVTAGDGRREAPNRLVALRSHHFAQYLAVESSALFDGTGIKNGISQEYTVKASGHAVSRTVIAGSMTYQKTAGNGPACKTTTKFRAKRTGPARS